MRPWGRFPALLAALALLVVACRETAQITSGPEQSGRLQRLRLSGGTFGYPSPFAYVRGPGMINASYIFDTLLWQDSTGEWIPWLAKDKQHSPDGKEWRFTLRDGIKWHDGEPLTADDVVFTFQYLTEGPGAEAPVIHNRGLDVIDEVIAETDTEVVFRLKFPYAAFEENIAGRMLIIPEHIWADVDDPVKLRGSEALIGSGPYTLESFDEATGSYLYVANDSFFLGEPYVARLEFVPAEDELLALTREEVDAAELSEEGAPEEQLEALRNDPALGSLEGSGDWNMALHFNMSMGFPYNDVRFRKAVAYAVDRQDLVDRILLGRGQPGSMGGLAPNHPWVAADLPTYERDLDRANALLDEIGLEDANGDGLRDLPDGSAFSPQLIASNRFSTKTPELVREYLLDVGIDAQVQILDQTAADAAAAEARYELALVGYGGLMADPDYVRMRLSAKIPSMSFNRAHGYDNPAFEKVAAQQMATIDEAERRRLVEEMQRIVSEDVPVLPLYVPTRVLFYREDIFQNWYYTPGCSPCRGSRNKHMFVTGQKMGL